MAESSKGRTLSRLESYTATVLRAAHYGGIVFVIAMMLLTVVHVIGRYAFNKPISGVIELSSYFLVAAVFLMGAYALMVKGHITIGIIVDRLSERTQAIIDSVTYMACLVFAILALWQSFVRAIYVMHTGQASAVLHISDSPFIIIVGIGWGLFSVAIVMHLVRFFTTLTKK